MMKIKLSLLCGIALLVAVVSTDSITAGEGKLEPFLGEPALELG